LAGKRVQGLYRENVKVPAFLSIDTDAHVQTSVACSHPTDSRVESRIGLDTDSAATQFVKIIGIAQIHRVMGPDIQVGRPVDPKHVTEQEGDDQVLAAL